MPLSDQDNPSENEHGNDRSPPVLANATYLLDNTQALLDEKTVEIHPKHIPTDYSSLTDTDRETNLANNLRLDLNLYYEEHLQRGLEHSDELLKDAKKIVAVIHEQLDFASLNGATPDVTADNLRALQIKTLTDQLRPFYPPGKLDEFLEGKDFTDEKFKPFLDTIDKEKLGKVEGSRIANKEYADGAMKLLKQIKTQLPYFGGSIEYQQNVHKSLEYYIYHMSTLTRDPEQQYRLDSPEGKLLPKGMKAYDTNPDGQLPFANQRNLGTGVVESQFEGLPLVMQGQIREAHEEANEILDRPSSEREKADQFTALLKQLDLPAHASAEDIWSKSNAEQRENFTRNLLGVDAEVLDDESLGKDFGELSADHWAKIQRPLIEIRHTSTEYAQADKFKALADKLGLDPKADPKDIWDKCNEDQKKHLFGDIMRLPWSEAHLHGGEGYEQTAQLGTLDDSNSETRRSLSRIGRLLPLRPGELEGLQNVAGVTANVLERPEVASQDYAEGGKLHGLETAYKDGLLEEVFDAVPTGESLQTEFENKHRVWHEDAMTNAKPQIGGVSGHTLGYMNVYLEALSKVDPAERAEHPEKYPSPERLRAIMLAGLVGTKRHHSYDEVMAASTGTRVTEGIPTLGYGNKDSYDDVRGAEDNVIRVCAQTAFKEARSTYQGEKNTVLATLTKDLEKTLGVEESEVMRTKLASAVDDYFDGMSKGENRSEQFVTAVSEVMKEAKVLKAVQATKDRMQVDPSERIREASGSPDAEASDRQPRKRTRQGASPPSADAERPRTRSNSPTRVQPPPDSTTNTRSRSPGH